MGGPRVPRARTTWPRSRRASSRRARRAAHDGAPTHRPDHGRLPNREAGTMLTLGFSPLHRRAAVIAGVLLSAAACSDNATAPRPEARVPGVISAVDNPDLSKIGVVAPMVDGKIGTGEYMGAAAFKFTATLPPSAFGGGSTPVTVYVTHDQTYLYLAATFDRKTPFRANDRLGF